MHEATRSALEQRRTRAGIPGASLALFRHGAPAFAYAGGVADIADGRSLTRSTPFRIGCLTKPLVAAVVLLLEADGKLRRDDRAADYVPALARSPEPGLGEITIAQLLSHHAGLPRGRYAVDPPLPADVLAAICAQGCTLPPGSGYKYSNWGYALLADIIAAVTGTESEDAMTHRLFAPLGMTGTRFESSGGDTRALATGYWQAWHFGYPDLAAPLAISPRLPLPRGAAGVISTPDDLARCFDSLMQAAAQGGDAFWPPSVVDGLLRPVARKAAGRWVSLGLFRDGDHEDAPWYFPGTGSGCSTFLLLMPRTATTGVAMCNRLTCNHELERMLSIAHERVLGSDDAIAPAAPTLPWAARFVADDGETVSLHVFDEDHAYLRTRSHRIQLRPYTRFAFHALAPLEMAQDSAHMLRLHRCDGRIASLTWGDRSFRSSLTPADFTDSDVTSHGPDSCPGVYEHPGFGRLAVRRRHHRLVLDFGTVYESPLEPIAPARYRQTRGPCRGEVIEFRAGDTPDNVDLLMSGMTFRKLTATTETTS